MELSNINDYECDIEFCGKAAILHQEAVKKQPADAKAAFKKEILKVIEKEVWTPVHEEDLTAEERELVLPMMKIFLQKLKPENSFDKFKVRVLMRGDL